MWANPVGDIRIILSDGPTDKLRYRKAVINNPDGVATTFKTFEMRRLSPLVGADGLPIGVFVNGVLAAVTAEDLPSGEFTLTTAPAEGDTITATYYVQWFLDSEITEFLIQAAQWVGQGSNFVDTTDDLQPAVKEYAASVAYQKLSSKFAEQLAETFQLVDAPDQKRFNPISEYMRISESKLKRAFQLRDDVYKNRKGRALAPISATVKGRVRDVPPNR